MKYCSDCKTLHNDECKKCSACSRELGAVSGSDPVSVTVVKGRDIDLIEATLKQEGVPCSFEPVDSSVYNSYNKKVSAESDNRLLVPYDFYSRAFDICIGLGLANEADKLLSVDDDIKEESTKTYDERFESATGVKRRTWQIVWIVIFIIAACLIIWGIDYVADLIKGNVFGIGAASADEAVKALVGVLGI